MKFIDFLFKYYLKSPKELVVLLGGKLQVGATITTIYARNLWSTEPIKVKLNSILKRSYIPENSKIQNAAHEIFKRDIFGGISDYGDEIMQLRMRHESLDWNFDALTNIDKAKADGLQSLSVLTRTIFSKKNSSSLSLSLWDRIPYMCSLVNPMVIKIPIVSIRNYLDVQALFAFNSIRRSQHPKAEDLISYSYDILFIQQKIANSLNEYLWQIKLIQDKKDEVTLMNSEIIAIMGADLIFTYLKATIEKASVLIANIYEIPNLESKKTHKQRIAALTAGIPINIQELPYFEFILDVIKSENIEELNSYCSGLLHKKGISDLQPHNYVGKNAEAMPLKKIYEVLIEQHAKNTAMLLGAFALLTDDLVNRDPPQLSEVFNLIWRENAGLA
ncbi:MAG: hypothetical protein ACXVAY_15660 [Mucilaginibacter sp.]